jgi:hypothetical protein
MFSSSLAHKPSRCSGVSRWCEGLGIPSSDDNVCKLFTLVLGLKPKISARYTEDTDSSCLDGTPFFTMLFLDCRPMWPPLSAKSSLGILKAHFPKHDLLMSPSIQPSHRSIKGKSCLLFFLALSGHSRTENPVLALHLLLSIHHHSMEVLGIPPAVLRMASTAIWLTTPPTQT